MLKRQRRTVLGGKADEEIRFDVIMLYSCADVPHVADYSRYCPAPCLLGAL